MLKILRQNIPLFILTSLLFACTGSDESGLKGQILSGESPLAGASVEIYLKAEKDRSTLPFATTSTDENGNYQISLPAGRYFIIGKKKLNDDGQTRMLMAECPANPVEVSESLRSVAPFPLREMGRDGALVPEPQTGLVGRLVHEGKPIANAFVYIYTEAESGLMGPSYGEAIRSEDDGSFRIDLPAGRFFLAARKRADGARMGEPEAGDLNGTYAGNPVAVVSGEYYPVGDFSLAKIDADQRQKRLAAGKFDQTRTRFEGSVVNRDGQPIEGIYVFAYLDSRMVGKPTHISAPTDNTGRYILNLGAGGTYYLGARSTYGGPLEPGEWVGTYDEQADHSVLAESGKAIALVNIVVREVW
jgi:hypothetical protein